MQLADIHITMINRSQTWSLASEPVHRHMALSSQGSVQETSWSSVLLPELSGLEATSQHHPTPTPTPGISPWADIQEGVCLNNDKALHFKQGNLDPRTTSATNHCSSKSLKLLWLSFPLTTLSDTCWPFQSVCRAVSHLFKANALSSSDPQAGFSILR